MFIVAKGPPSYLKDKCLLKRVLAKMQPIQVKNT